MPIRASKARALTAIFVILASPGWMELAVPAAWADSSSVAAARLPGARDNGNAVFDGTHAYHFGGDTTSGRLSQIVRYDPASDTVATMGARLPSPRGYGGAAWSGQYAYYFGGWDGGLIFNDVVRFDPATDQAQTVAHLPQGREYVPAVWIAGKAYLFGGYSLSGGALNTILRFDPATNQVETVGATLPQGRYGMGAVTDGNYAYVFGGRTEAGTLFRDIFEYDPVADTLTARPAQLPAPRWGMLGAVWTGDRMVLFGGNPGDLSKEILTYEPATETVASSDVALPSARYGTAAAWDADRATAYVFGGYDGSILDAIVRWSPDEAWGLTLAGLVRNGFDGAAGCATLGFTSCAPGLDQALSSGQEAGFSIDMGEFVAFKDFAPPRPFGFGLLGSVAYRQSPRADFDVAEVLVGASGARAGLVSVVGGEPCLRKDAASGCSNLLAVDPGLVNAGSNPVSIRMFAASAYAAAGITDGPRLTVRAAAMQLAAPPTLVLHGFEPDWILEFKSDYECANGNVVGDRNDLPTWPDPANGLKEDWRWQLNRTIRTRTVAAIGQDPWGYNVGNDEGMNPSWSYCGRVDWMRIAGEFAHRLATLRKDGYDGKVWVIAHSMGGLVVRQYAEFLDRANSPVSRLLTMGTPHMGTCLGTTWSIISAVDGQQVYDLWKGTLADSSMSRSLNPQFDVLKGLGPSPSIDYFAMGGRHPASLPFTCGEGDVAVPVKSALYRERLSSGKSFREQVENCVPHSNGLPGIHEPAYYSDGQSISHMVEWLLAPYAPYDHSTDRPFSSCPGNIGAAVKQGIDKGVGWAKKTSQGAADGVARWWDRTVHDLTDLSRWRRCCVSGLGTLDAGAPDSEPPTERALELTGRDVDIVLSTRPDATLPDLELVGPDGAVLREGDDLPWVERERAMLFDVSFNRWHLAAPSPGTWLVRARLPAGTTEDAPLQLDVTEEGGQEFAVSTGRSTYRQGETTRLLVDFEAPIGATGVSVEATIKAPSTTKAITLRNTVPGRYEADVALEESGVHSVVVRASGILDTGTAFGLQEPLDIRVLRDIDWALAALEVSRPYAWFGEPMEASATLCSVGSEAALGAVTANIWQSDRLVAAAAGELPDGADCLDLRAEWPALPGGEEDVRASALSVIPQRSDSNDAATAPFRVNPHPYTTARLSGTQGNEGWWISPVGVRLAPFDDSSPLPITYRLDGGAVSEYVGAFALSADGNWRLEYQAHDLAAGEDEPLRFATVPIDLTPPVTDVTTEGLQHAGEKGLVVDPSARFAVVATDPVVNGVASGVATAACKVLGPDGRAAYPDCNNGFQLAGDDGIYTIVSWATDRAGNQETPHAFSVLLDNTSPVVDVVTPEPGSIAEGTTGVTARTDRDGDGFADAVEEAWGSLADLNLSTPLTRQAATNPGFDGEGAGIEGWDVIADAGNRVARVPEDAPWPPREPAGTGSSAEFSGPAGGATLTQETGTGTIPFDLGIAGVALDAYVDADVTSIEGRFWSATVGETFAYVARLGPDDLRANAWQRIVLPTSAFTRENIPRDGATLEGPYGGKMFSLRIAWSASGSGGTVPDMGFDVAHARVDNLVVYMGAPSPPISGGGAATDPSPSALLRQGGQDEMAAVVVGPWLDVTVRAVDPVLAGSNAGVARAHVEVDGIPALEVPLVAGDHWSWRLRATDYAPGEHTLVATVEDGLGHASRAVRRIALVPFGMPAMEGLGPG